MENETIPADMAYEHLLDKPRVYADLNGSHRDADSYVLFLNSVKTEVDFRKFAIQPREGLVVDFWTEDGDDEGRPDPLLFTAMLHHDLKTERWYAVAEWDGFRHASEAPETKVAERAVA